MFISHLYIVNVITRLSKKWISLTLLHVKWVLYCEKIRILRLACLQIVVFFLNFRFDFVKLRLNDRFLFFMKNDNWISTRLRLNVVNVSSTLFKFFFFDSFIITKWIFFSTNQISRHFLLHIENLLYFSFLVIVH